MGFYGHITNLQKTSMTFDRIYSSRTAMDGHAKTDQVYAGRYVLIEYDSPLDPIFLSGVIQFDGFLYAPPPAKTADEIAAMKTEEEYLISLQPLKVGAELTEDIVDGYIRPGAIVICSSDRNYGIVENKDREKSLVSISRTQYFQIATADNRRPGYNLLFNYKTSQYQLGAAASQEEKVGCAYVEIPYSKITTDHKAADVNYLINFNIDKEHYSTARGYDSTVWQKTYVDGEAKYVMIAELNSVVPILDISADAPTLAPVMPHFDKNSTNVYYKLHMQPSWGFRVKAASHNLTIPTLDYSGSQIKDSTGKNILAGKHNENYPSDEKVTWMNTILEDNNYTHHYLVTDEENTNLGIWQSKDELGDNSEAQIDGAIYYNKAGFDKKISTHSSLLPRVTPIVDEISLTPTGFSGHLYPTHTTDNLNIAQPDVNELTVMLPSIGDTVADMWDIIYGTAKMNGTHEGDGGTGTYERNTVIRWEDAKKVLAKEGLRLVKTKDGLPGCSYDTDAVNTLAGVINSAQDIIGMIITNDYPIDTQDIKTIEKLNEDYIYYDSTTGKYYFKKRDYTYTPVADDFEYEKVELENWENYKTNTWWVDTNNILKPDYIREDTFRPERKYVQGVKVPGEDDDGDPRKFDAVEYEEGKYYLYTDKVRGTNNPLVDDTTKKPYHEYYLSHEARDVNKQYWKITPTPQTLESNTTYYVPNKYYAGYFYEAKIVDEEDFERQLTNGVRLFLRAQSSDTYNISIIERELKSGDYALIGERPVFYLTLKTYSATEEEYAAFKKDDSEKPILFASDLVKSDGAQNYYVVSRKYELFTDTKTIEASPGVYFKLRKEKDQAEYLEAGNILKAVYVGNLELEQDVIVDEGYLYFREVVELILNTNENVVNIADAQIVYPKALPEDLYQLYTKILDDGSTYKAYKKISAQSSEIVGTKDLGTLQNLYTLKIEELALGYLSETYYYQVTDNEDDYYQSVILDNHLESTKEREYWLPEMINKRKMTTEEIKKGKVAGITYYVFDKPNNTYKVYTGELYEGSTYYVNSLTEAPEFYYANKYYYQNENGEFVLDTSEEFTEGRDYYKDPQLYIYEDPNKFYDRGAIWPLAQNPPENSGIVLATREETWTLEELKGFDVHYNTLHGLILRLNKMMLQGDDETRDEETVQGSINKLTDLIHRFGQMKPGQPMIVDDTGRMHGANISTAQKFNAINYGGQAVEVEKMANACNYDAAQDISMSTYNRKITEYNNLTSEEQIQLDNWYKSYGWGSYEEYISAMTLGEGGLEAGENLWISCDVDADYTNPLITLRHNFTKVKDTVSESDMNEPVSDTIDLYAPIVDNKGHVVGHNTETVTLPYGFKSIASINNPSENDITVLPHNALITADNTQDLFTIRSANKWLRFGANADTDVLTIAHETHFVELSQAIENQNTDAKDVLGPVLTDITFDAAGHLNSYEFTSYTLPYGFKTITVENTDENVEAPDIPNDLNNVVADTTQDTLKLTANNQWIRLIPDADADTINFAHETHNVGTATAPLDLNTAPESTRDTLSAVGSVGFDKAGHVQAINYWKYTLPFGYKTITDGKNNSVAQNTQDSLTVSGDNWIKPVVSQGVLTYTHINNNTIENFNPAGSHILGAQTPAFGESFNLQTYTLDDNGHIINKGMETVTLPIDIAPLKISEDFNDEDNVYVKKGMSLQGALSLLDRALIMIGTSLTQADNEIKEDIQVLRKDISEHVAEAENTYALIEGNINSETVFEYTPEVEEVSHAATQEDVDAGFAAAVGDKIIDVEYVPAEELTIQELFNKVKALEQLLNS